MGLILPTIILMFFCQLNATEYISVRNVGQESPNEACVQCSTATIGWYDRQYFGKDEVGGPIYDYIYAYIPYSEPSDLTNKLGIIKARFRYKLAENCINGNDYIASRPTLLIDLNNVCFMFSETNTNKVAPDLITMLKAAQKEITQSMKYYFYSGFYMQGNSNERKWYEHLLFCIDPVVPEYVKSAPEGDVFHWYEQNWNRNFIKFMFPCSFYRNDILVDNNWTGICYEQCSYNCCSITYFLLNDYSHSYKIAEDKYEVCPNHWTVENRILTSSPDCISFPSQNCIPVCSENLFAFEIGQNLVKEHRDIKCTACTTNYFLKRIKNDSDINTEIEYIKVYDILGNYILTITDLDNDFSNLSISNIKGIMFLQYFNKENVVVKTKSLYFE